MYAITRNSKVIATSKFKPSSEDLKSRGEVGIICKDEVNIGWTYSQGIFTAPVISSESLLISIRIQRDLLLSSSDAMMLIDYPTGKFTRDQWVNKVLVYRQALRDFPEICDLNNPIYPNL